MVWGGISYDSATDLYLSETDISIVLATGMKFLRLSLGLMLTSLVMILDDNAIPHRARVVNQYIEQETIARMK